MAEKLIELENRLRDLSHNDQALKIIQEFAEQLGKTKERQIIFSSPGALIREPIEYQKMRQEKRINDDEAPFELLQGDMISTNAAYLCGERLQGMKFAIASSTCDLVESRRKYAALLRLDPITTKNPKAAQILGELLKFKSTQRMYIPRLEDDPEEVIANSIVFDGIVQIELSDLLMSTRYASLSLVGWRIFGSLVRYIMVRTGDSEVRMRS